MKGSKTSNTDKSSCVINTTARSPIQSNMSESSFTGFKQAFTYR